MKKNQIAIVAIILLFVVGGGVYAFTQYKPTPKIGQQVELKKGDVAKGSCVLNDQILCANLKAAAAVSSMTSTSTSVGPDGKATTITFKTLTKENKTLMEMKDEKGNFTSQIITIDGITYMKNPGQDYWTKMNLPKPSAQPGEPRTFEEIQEKYAEDPTDGGKTTFVYEGKEACGKLTCHKYKMTTQSGETDQMVVYHYIDDKQYLTRRMVMKASGPQGGDTDMTYSYEPVTITVPSPVKEMSSIEDMMKDALPMGQTVDPEALKKMQDIEMPQFEMPQGVPGGVESNMTEPQE